MQKVSHLDPEGFASLVRPVNGKLSTEVCSIRRLEWPAHTRFRDDHLPTFWQWERYWLDILCSAPRQGGSDSQLMCDQWRVKLHSRSCFVLTPAPPAVISCCQLELSSCFCRSSAYIQREHVSVLRLGGARRPAQWGRDNGALVAERQPLCHLLGGRQLQDLGRRLGPLRLHIRVGTRRGAGVLSGLFTQLQGRLQMF